MNLKHKSLLFSAVVLMFIYSISVAIAPRITMEIIDRLTDKSSLSNVKNLIWLFVVVSLVQAISRFISDYSFSLIGKKVTTEIKIKILNQLFRLDGEYLSNMNVGEHLNILDVDTSLIEEVATRTMFSIISDIVTSVFMLFMLLTLQWDLVVFVVGIQVTIVFMQIYFNKKILALKKQTRKINGEITNIEQELLSGFVDIVQLNGKKYFFHKFIEKTREVVKKNLKLEFLFGMNNLIGMSLTLITVTFVLVYGAYKISIGTLTVGGLIAFSIYSQKIISPILRIIRSNLQIQQSIISLDRIFSLLDTNAKIKKNNNIKRPLNGLVQFSDVEFSYKSMSKKMKYSNIELKPNSVNIITGSSGIGKTTMTKLLYRLWDVNSGTINIDKKHIEDYNLNYLRKNLGIVSQDTIIFTDSVIHNITLMKDKISKEYVYEICKLVELHDVIMELPNKYETLLGGDGINLSGGQLQRLAIARAIISDPKILIMDEPTSSLDEELEIKLLENILGFLKKRTTIIITHRKIPIRYGDYIYDCNKLKSCIDKENDF